MHNICQDRVMTESESGELHSGPDKGGKYAPVQMGPENDGKVRDQAPGSLRGSITKRLKCFCLSTSVKAIPRAVKGETTCLRWMWAVFAVCLMILAGALTLNLLFDYGDFDVVASFDEYMPFADLQLTAKKMIPQSFPAVTLCNVHPFRNDREYFPEGFSDYYAGIEVRIQASSLSDENKAHLLRYVRSSQGYFENLGVQATTVGHQNESFILSCDFLVGPLKTKVPCHQLATIRRFLTAEFFNCYTIELKEQHEYGQIVPRGVSVVLFTDSFGIAERPVVKFDGEEMGAVVTVHPPKTLPNIGSNGHYVSVGQHTLLRTAIKIRRRLGPPYSECVPDPGTFTNWEGHTYEETLMTCIDRCQGELTAETCGCFDTAMISVAPNRLFDYPFCGCFKDVVDLPTVASRLNCTHHMHMIGAHHCAPKCELPCNENTYALTLSNARWPSPESHAYFYNTYIKGREFEQRFRENSLQDYIDGRALENLVRESVDRIILSQMIQNNFAKLTVLGQGEVIQVVLDKAEWTWGSLAAQIGGTLNLWAGITVVLVVELLDLFVHMCRIVCGHRDV